jgi:hypothetical protein
MKTRLLKIIFAVLFLCPVCADATITRVSISPDEPTLIDPITILVSGTEGSPAQITNTDFLVNDNSLLLDIYLDLGIIPVVTSWTHSEPIGTLPGGVYNLTVQTLFPLLPPLNDNYSMSFEVVPEPGTLGFLAAGLLVFRVFLKRKI